MKIVTPTLRQTVREAGLLAKNVRAEGLSRMEKLSKDDIVTSGDTAVSGYLREKLSQLLPGIVIVDEEDAKSHGFNIGGLQFAAVVDPIDGTTNYYEGSDNCGVSVGIIVDGEPIAGIIHQFGNDQLFWAERGYGAFCNGERLRMSRTQQLASAHGMHSIPYSHRLEQRARMERIIAALRDQVENLDVLGSQVIELMQVALGKRDFFIMNDTKPWDVAAAIAIIYELGGIVVDMQGKHYRLGESMIIATNGWIAHEQIIELIQRLA